MINLLPPSEKNKKHRANQSLLAMIIVAVVLMVTALAGIILINLNTGFDTKIKEQKNTQVALEGQIKKASIIQKDIADSIERITLLSELSGQRIVWSEIIAEFSQVVPKNVKILSFSASGSPLAFSLSGETITRQNVEDFRARIEASPYFEKAFYNSTTEQTDGTVNKVSFSLTFSLEKATK